MGKQAMRVKKSETVTRMIGFVIYREQPISASLICNAA